MFGCEAAVAQAAEDIRKFAKVDKTGKTLTKHELDVYRLHQASEILRKYDRNRDGVIDAQEALEITNDARKAQAKGLTGAQSDEIVEVAGERDRIPVEDLVKRSPVTVADNDKSDEPQRLYIRRNKIDAGIAGFAKNPVPTADAEGARVSYARDGLTNIETWDLEAFASYVIAAGDWPEQEYKPGVPMVTAYAMVPWVGIRRSTSTDPQAKRADKISLGADSVFEVYNFLGGAAYVSLTPSFQTDRESEASIFDFAAHMQGTGILEWAAGIPSCPAYRSLGAVVWT
jgi:hypothetical protein